MSMFSRIIRSGLSPNQGIQCRRAYAKKPPDPLMLMTGKELYEALEHIKGNDNPFYTKPIKRGPGTRECPNVIKSFDTKRMVGCICHPDNNHVNWFFLHEGYPRRCKCNYWFVLERVEQKCPYEDYCELPVCSPPPCKS